MKLFARWNSKNPKKAEAAKAADAQLLQAEIALAAEVRVSDGIEKMNPADAQLLLAEMAKTDADSNVRIAAIKHLIAEEHQPLLAEIATTDADKAVCLAAIEKLTDQPALIEIAGSSRHYELKKAALKNFDEQSLESIPNIVVHVMSNSLESAALADFIQFAYKVSKQEQKQILRKFERGQIHTDSHSDSCSSHSDVHTDWCGDGSHSDHGGVRDSRHTDYRSGMEIRFN
ncbi:MAG: hypothetical protein LBD21_08420 [Tannerellaceae bacterium]|jgi:hypothetical protein|nr:hypothetical protein [Tannerellaceae bacterium]